MSSKLSLFKKTNHLSLFLLELYSTLITRPDLLSLNPVVIIQTSMYVLIFYCQNTTVIHVPGSLILRILKEGSSSCENSLSYSRRFKL